MRRVILALFGTVTGLIVLLGFKTHSPSHTIPAAVATGPANAGTGSSTAGSSGATPSASTSGSGAASSSSGSAASSAPKSSAVASGTKTVTGDAVDTRWGPVQVQITVTNGNVTSAQAIVYPQNNERDLEINSYAIPALNQEAVTAGSAQIDMISGATVTSGGYLSSLQSALNKAGV